MTDSIVDEIIVPLYGIGDEDLLVRNGSVLASWLGVPLQLVAPDEAAARGLEEASRSISVQSRPVRALSTPSFLDGLVSLATSVAPALCVTSVGRGGTQLAVASKQTTLLIGDSTSPRLRAGPLAVEVTGHDSDIEAISTAAMWATALDIGIRLVVDEASTDGDELAVYEDRLSKMGLDVGVDRLRSHGLQPLVLVARSRESLAMVIPADRLDEPDLVDKATRQGVSVLVAPSDRARLDHTISEQLADTAPAEHHGDTDLLELDQTECWARIEQHRVGRMGYVNDGWPTVVPVNYSPASGEVFIRSLQGGKAEAAARHEVVCLEIDHIDEVSRSGWSVVAHGHLENVVDAATLKVAWENDPGPWVDSDSWQWLRFIPFSVAGRTLSPDRV